MKEWFLMRGKITLGLDSTFNQKSLPRNISALHKRLRWGKYINSLTINRSYYEPYQKYFLKYLCQNYNEKLPDQIGRITKVELWWGWRHVKDFEDFGEVEYGKLEEINCN